MNICTILDVPNLSLFFDFLSCVQVNGSHSWPVVWSEAKLLDQFRGEKDSLVYLTHESSTVLKELSEDEVRSGR